MSEGVSMRGERRLINSKGVVMEGRREAEAEEKRRDKKNERKEDGKRW